MFLIAAALIAYLKQWKLSRNYFLIGLGTLIFGLSLPVALTWLIAQNHSTDADYLIGFLAILTVVLSLVSAVVSLGLLYLPVHIAKNRQKPLGWIIGLSAF